jgi:glycosyltransferase involved in cell wall biosynthesis
MTLVSILIPAYNAERWIGDTIQSALSQTWRRKEVIIVDDGSRDDTVAVARRYASSEVCVVQQANQGASAARNKAFSLCQGDFIQWLDADDLLSPEKIERQMAVLASGSSRLLASCPWGYFYYRPHKAAFLPMALWSDLSPVEWLLRKLGQNLHMQTATWLVSRELTEAAGPWDVRLMSDDDGEYFCRVLLASDGVRFVREARVYYRVSGPGSWGNLGRSRKQLEAQWLSMQLHIRYLRSLEESQRVRAACLQFLQTWFLYFYREQADLAAQFEAVARELGGELRTPRLSWKYAWIHKLFGWPVAKRASMALPQFKASLLRYWDGVMYHDKKDARGARG